MDLVRLDRDERRARARQDRAIREFINRKLTKRLEAESAGKEDSPLPGAPSARIEPGALP